MKVIGLTGKARAGKDTAGDIIVEWYNENGMAAKKVAFAKKLKVSAAAALGYTGDDPIGFCESLKHKGKVAYWFPNEGSPSLSESNGQYISGRDYLQRYGTEAHREVFGKDFWVEALMEELQGDDAEYWDAMIVTDVRFDNEAFAIDGFPDREPFEGGEVWQIVRPAQDEADLGSGTPNHQLRLNPDEELHASEGGVDPALVRRTIVNNGDLDSLRNKVRVNLHSMVGFDV